MTTNAVEKISKATFAQRLRCLFGGVVLASVLVQGAVAASAQTFDREAFLKAVAEVETGGNPRAIGRFGERGLYQFGRATWTRHTKRAFVDAHDPAIAHDIAVKHFVWLYGRLEANGATPDAYRMAVAWNGGLGRAISGRAPKSTRDYARRVAVLAERLQASREAASSLAATAPATTEDRAMAVSLDFSIDDALVAYYAAPEVVLLDDPTNEVSFSLAATRGKTNGSSRRFFLATIVE